MKQPAKRSRECPAIEAKNQQNQGDSAFDTKQAFFGPALLPRPEAGRS
jgi:hypothetical protein